MYYHHQQNRQVHHHLYLYLYVSIGEQYSFETFHVVDAMMIDFLLVLSNLVLQYLNEEMGDEMIEVNDEDVELVELHLQ